MAISLKRTQPTEPTSSTLPQEIQEQVNKSGVISAPKKIGLIEKIRTAVGNFFGGDINERIQKTYTDLNSKGIDDSIATKMAIELVKNKGFVTKSIEEDYKNLPDNLKQVVLQAGTNIVGKQAQDVVISSTAPGKGLFGGGKQVAKKVAEKTGQKVVPSQEARKYKSIDMGNGLKRIETSDKSGWIKYYTEGDKIIIPDFQVNASVRNKGIGSGLLNEVEKIAAKEGKDVQLSALTDRGTSPKSLVDFYKKRGYVENGSGEMGIGMIKTKSQLTDIYNQAIKTAPGATPQVVSEVDPIQKVIQALKEAKPIRAQQQAIYAAERGAKLRAGVEAAEKIGGQAGFIAKKAALKGELTKLKFESIIAKETPEVGDIVKTKIGILGTGKYKIIEETDNAFKVREISEKSNLKNTVYELSKNDISETVSKGKIVQTDIDNLFNRVQNSANLTEWEKFPAAQGLQKMFTGQVPTEGEIKILSRVLPQEMITELGKKQGFNLLGEIEGALNLPRAVMTSLDLSFGGRQGAFLGTRYRQEFAKNWVKQFELFGSENAYKASQEAMRTNKYFNLAQKSGLSFTDIASGMDNAEEAFMSKWVDKLPGVRQSARAYTGFANKFRMDVFSRLANNAEKLGLDLETVGKNGKTIAEDIAKFVNVGTGRGGLGVLEPIAKELNAVFFSPRLMSSRLTLMNPLFYVKLNPYVRKEALKTLFTFGSTWTTILGIASTIPGVEVGTDPRSSDFGKIKIGNTRVDIGAGFQQYLRSAGQLITGKYISSTTGKEYTLGEGYKPMTRFDILLRQAETKSSPIASFIIDMLQGQDAVGNKFDLTQEIIDRFIPMVTRDTFELAQDNPDLLPIEVLGLFGIGVQTYQPQKKTTTKKGGGTSTPSLKRK